MNEQGELARRVILVGLARGEGEHLAAVVGHDEARLRRVDVAAAAVLDVALNVHRTHGVEPARVDRVDVGAVARLEARRERGRPARGPGVDVGHGRRAGAPGDERHLAAGLDVRPERPDPHGVAAARRLRDLDDGREPLAVVVARPRPVRPSHDERGVERRPRRDAEVAAAGPLDHGVRRRRVDVAGAVVHARLGAGPEGEVEQFGRAVCPRLEGAPGRPGVGAERLGGSAAGDGDGEKDGEEGAGHRGGEKVREATRTALNGRHTGARANGRTGRKRERGSRRREPRPTPSKSGLRQEVATSGAATSGAATAAESPDGAASRTNVSHPCGSAASRTAARYAVWMSSVIGPRRPVPTV